MNSLGLFQNLLIKIYSVINRTGFLDYNFSFKLFKFFYFLYKKNFEDPYYYFCKRYPETLKNGYILDIGANIGYTSSVFSTMVSEQYCIFSFEPEINNFRWLSKIAQGKDSRIVPIHAAVGERNGDCILELNKNSHADHTVHAVNLESNLTPNDTFQIVPLVALDNFVSERNDSVRIDKIAFVKIDVQGFEMEVLKGMTQIIENSKDLVISLEIAEDSLKKFNSSSEDILSYLKTKGFNVGMLKKNGMIVPLEKTSTTPYYDVVFFRGSKFSLSQSR